MYPWRHPDPRVDDLQRAVMEVVAGAAGGSRADVFERLWSLANGVRPLDIVRLKGSDPFRPQRSGAATQPYMTEGWYCCAEPGPEQLDLV